MDMELVMRAAAYAGEAHKKQLRKSGDEPYINHPLRVAHVAVKAGLSAEAVAASLLHDVVEDTERTLDDVRSVFPERVAHLVHLLTQWWADDAPQAIKAEGKPKYYAAIRREPEAIALKLIDRADNLWSMVRMLPSNRGWAERYLKRTQEEIAPLHKACDNALAKAAYVEAIDALTQALANRSARP